MKKHCWFWLLFFLLLIPEGFSERMGVLYDAQHPVYQRIVYHFKVVMAEMGHQVKTIPYSLGEEEKNLKKIDDAQCSHIFSIGTAASKIALRSGYPGVYTMVPDPLKSGLLDQKNGGPSGKMLGVSIHVSPEKQFLYLKTIFKKKKKIGMVYDSKVSDPIVKNILQQAEKYDFQIQDLAIQHAKQIPSAFKTLKKNKVHFFLSVMDDTVYNAKSFRFILKFSILNRIPLIGFSRNQVKAGALLGFYCDYPMLGVQCAELMKNMLEKKKEKGEGLYEAQYIQHAVNLRMAKMMRIRFPKPFLDDAAKIFGE